jgi:phosphopantetheinyl transferase
MEPFFHTTGNGTIWAISAIGKSSEELMDLLDKKDMYLPYIRSVSLESRKREWLSARVLFKKIFQEEKEILYLPNGKPYFADRSFHISISHTKGYVAVALNEKHPVGIDIEYISPRINKIRDRFMNEEENRHLSADNEEIQLLLHWSAKESLFKILGIEDVDFKSCLHISPFCLVMHECSSFSARETRTAQRQEYTVRYLANEAYVVTVAEER